MSVYTGFVSVSN